MLRNLHRLFALLAGVMVATASARNGPDAEVVARELLALPGGSRSPALSPVLRSRYRSESIGVTHLCFAQTVDGIPIENGDLLVNVGPRGGIVNFHGHFGAATISPAARVRGRRMRTESVVDRSAELIGLAGRRAGGWMGVEKEGGVRGRTHRFGGGDLAIEPIAVEEVWHRDARGRLIPAWRVQIRPQVGKHDWHLVISDLDGSELDRIDLVLEAGSYRVLPLPLSDPGDGPTALLTGVEDGLASPFGWHDINGAAGAEYSDTRGNNINAFEDRDGNDAGGLRPSGGAGLVFDHPSNSALGGFSDRNLSIVNSFYVANVCHDLFYRYGFNEAAGNFQLNNYGRGGAGSDWIRLQTEDPGALRNAFFYPSVDGASPIMEFGMVPRPSTLTITAPAAVAGIYASQAPEIGSWTSESGFTGEIVAAVDAADAAGPSTADCCSTPTNAAALAGKIALIDRGGCFFDDKIKLAEQAGAVGVIIVNRTDPSLGRNGEDLVTMQGDDYTLGIPGIFIRESDGGIIRAALGGGGGPVMASMVSPVRNIGLDSQVVIHEYAHGLTTRLTGGPASATCLSGLVSGGMGEGWSDWFALVMTAKSGDAATDARPIAAYTDPPAGFRRFLYSTDRSVNGLSYADIGIYPEVHALGEVWCAVLWDMYWDLVRHYGFSPDLTQTFNAGGNNLAMQLVIDGLKLQPCSPSFVDGRDAIVLADQLLTGGANAYGIWNAFARRGLGENATEGANDSDTSVSESYAVPAGLDLADNDSDGIENLLETALGGDYLRSDPGILPEVILVAVSGQQYPAIRYRRLVGGAGTTGVDYEVDGIRYSPERDDDLSGFGSATGQFVVVSVEPGADPGIEVVTLRSTLPIAGTPRQFFRLRVTRTAS